MKKSILLIGLVIALMTVVFGAAQKMTCRITVRTIDQCCCEMKDEKFYCKLTKKTYDKCCCDMK